MKFIKIQNCIINVDEILYVEQIETSNPNIEFQMLNDEFIKADHSKDQPEKIIKCKIWFRTTNESVEVSKEFQNLKLEEVIDIMKSINQ